MPQTQTGSGVKNSITVVIILMCFCIFFVGMVLLRGRCLGMVRIAKVAFQIGAMPVTLPEHLVVASLAD